MQHVAEEAMSGVGSRGGNVRDLDTARDLQAGSKDKRDWRGAIDEQIRRTLLETGYFHADDLDALCVPPEHAQLKGTRSAWFRNQGFMEKTGAERKVSHKAANGRKAAIHRITPKGRRELTVGINAGVPDPQGPEGSVDALDRTSVDPGGARPTGAPTSKESGRATNPPVPSASDQSGSSGEGRGASQTSSESARLPGFSAAPSMYDPQERAA